MQECKVCKKEFDLELSRKPIKEILDIGFNPLILTDSREDEFCSKWCEKKWHDENDEKVYVPGHFEVSVMKPVISPTLGKEISSKKVLNRELKRRGIVNTNDLDTPIKRMERDKTMVSMIKNGKASDPGLKREAEAISREYEDKRKQFNRQKDSKELFEMKKKFKMLPEQRRHLA